MHDTDTKNLLTIYIILGACDFAKIKMGTCARQVRLVNHLLNKQKQVGLSCRLVEKVIQRVHDYKKLCDTDVLELKKSHQKNDGYVYEKFNKQLTRDKEGWYETGLAWKGGNLPLVNNKNGSLGILKSLVRNLKQNLEIDKAYDTGIQEQVQNKVIERVSNNEISN